MSARTIAGLVEERRLLLAVADNLFSDTAEEVSGALVDRVREIEREISGRAPTTVDEAAMLVEVARSSMKDCEPDLVAAETLVNAASFLVGELRQRGTCPT